MNGVGLDEGIADTGQPIDPVPAQTVRHKSVMLDNAGNPSMDVDGSTTAVNYDFDASEEGTGAEVFVTGFRLVIIDDGSWLDTEFANLGAKLTNKILIQVQSKGTVHEIMDLENNMELFAQFEQSQMIINEANLFGNRLMFKGSVKFDPPIILRETDSDFFRLKVQDDLGPLQEMQAGIQFWVVT